jgi:thiol-disulfide isomerase/thioredoxin
MKRLWLLVFLVFVLLSAPLVAAARGPVFPDIGHRLPTIQFTDLVGKEHSLDWSSSERSTTIILFFEPRCADCFREMVFFDSVSRLAEGLNLEVFAIEGTGREPKELAGILAKIMSIFQLPPYIVVPDPSYELSTLFNVKRVPSTFLVERHGVVISRKEGFDDRHAVDLARKIERLLDVDKGKFSPALASLGVTGDQTEAYETAEQENRRAKDTHAFGTAPLTVGTKVEPFDYEDVTVGPRKWAPSEGEKKATVVFFWGSLCQPCIREMAYLEKLRTAAGPDALEVIAIEGTGLDIMRVNKEIANYKKFSFPISYPVAIDPEGKTGQHFGVKGTLPQTFLLGSDGEVLYHTDEFVEGGELRLAARIEAAMGLEEASLMAKVAQRQSSDEESSAGKPMPVPEDPAIRSEEFTARLVLAETLYRKWQYAAAVPHYLRCVELDSKSVLVKERLAQIYERQGELALAVEERQKILELEPGHLEATKSSEKLKKSLKQATTP